MLKPLEQLIQRLLLPLQLKAIMQPCIFEVALQLSQTGHHLIGIKQAGEMLLIWGCMKAIGSLIGLNLASIVKFE